MKQKIKYTLLLLLVIIGLSMVFVTRSVMAVSVSSFPDFPMSFYGNATINNSNLNADTKIYVFSDNNIVGEVTLLEDGIYGYNNPTKIKLLINEYTGNQLIFKYSINGEIAENSVVEYNGIFESGKTINKNLEFISLEDKQVLLASTTLTVSPDLPEVLVGINATTSTTTISIGKDINNAILNVSALMTTTSIDSSIVLPSPVIFNSDTNIGKVHIKMPKNIKITGNSTWNGKINMPQIKSNSSVTNSADAGHTSVVTSVIEIGYDDKNLTFDKAVRILLENQAGKLVGYSRSGVFTKITETCSIDTQGAGNALATGGNCKINVGSDLVIWTKHFTKFATYTQITTPAPVSSGGGGGGGGDTSAPTNISIIINNGIATSTSKTVSLSLTASDSSIISMMISNNSSFDDAIWENFDTTKSWTLTNENGEKTVYVKFKDTTGNTSNSVQDTIILSELITEEVEEIEEETNNSDVKVLGVEYDITNDVNYIIEETIKKEKEAITEININLSKRVSGRILLQVEEHGEAWYVNPKDNNKYYMANGDKAYSIMRYLSVGITNKDLERVMSDKEFAKKHSGKIFLQVEAHGEAYYIDTNGNAHYLKDGIAAYTIMRDLGLGITNNDLRGIGVGDIK